MKWRKSFCERTLYYHGVRVANFCVEPGHEPLRHFVGNVLDGYEHIRLPPRVGEAKKILERAVRKYEHQVCSGKYLDYDAANRIRDDWGRATS
jgi:hypothetical protein